MTGTDQNSRMIRRIPRSLARISTCAMLTALAGCEVDSFMDPSVIGRWEPTPTVMPILDRLSAIEDETGEFVQTTPVTASDLIPEPDQYRLAAGDSVDVIIRDYFEIGREETFQRTVDARGMVEIPRLPQVRAQGRTSSELVIALEDAIRNQRINDRPVVTVVPTGQRKQTFSVLGATRNPGTYFIPSPDYRLLEGLTAAGGADESVPFIYVIRQVSLTDEAAGVLPPSDTNAPTRPGMPRINPPAPAPTEPPRRSEELIDLIDELSKQPKSEKPSPGMVGEGRQPSMTTRQPEPPQTGTPVIDLPDSSSQGSAQQGSGQPRSGWVYVDGQWVKVAPTGEVLSGPGASSSRRQVTQRVIKVPNAPLLAGAADVNIVLRPGDVIRVPPAKSGLVYFAGQVARPGPITMPTEGRLTLLRGIDSVGGLGGLAIPERTDLTRVVGEGRQATIRVNLRAISEQTQPDFYLKPDDRINVGTNFFAVPLAILRGGLRASYGFGFILDRNFQGDVFGADRATTNFNN